MTGDPQPGSDAVTTLRAALDVLVFAPIGLGVKLVDDAPDAVERARQELSNARFIGRLAVTQGVAQIRENLEQRSVEPETTTVSTAEQRDDIVDEPVDVPNVGDLALPDYEHLPAIDIVAKLAGLDGAERDAIERYESAHRRRRTVLGKLEQLAADA